MLSTKRKARFSRGVAYSMASAPPRQPVQSSMAVWPPGHGSYPSLNRAIPIFSADAAGCYPRHSCSGLLFQQQESFHADGQGITFGYPIAFSWVLVLVISVCWDTKLHARLAMFVGDSFLVAEKNSTDRQMRKSLLIMVAEK